MISPARNDSHEQLFGIQYGDALHPMVHHQLQYARQLRRRIDIDEFRRHDVGDHPGQQVVIGWNHTAGIERKALQKVELAHDADDVVAIADRVTVEIVLVEHSLQFAHGGLARDGLHRARHVLSGGGFEKSMHGSSSSSSFLSETETRNGAIQLQGGA